jgi:hypothetical protein
VVIGITTLVYGCFDGFGTSSSPALSTHRNRWRGVNHCLVERTQRLPTFVRFVPAMLSTRFIGKYKGFPIGRAVSASTCDSPFNCAKVLGASSATISCWTANETPLVGRCAATIKQKQQTMAVYCINCGNPMGAGGSVRMTHLKPQNRAANVR